MIKLKKGIIIGIVIGIAICGLSVYAATIASSSVSYDNKNSGSTATNVQGALDDLYENSYEGKIKIAQAITNKGINTSETDSYDTIVSNINNIPTGIVDADKVLYQSLKYSGIVTENMTFEQMNEALANYFPQKITIVSNSIIDSDFTSNATTSLGVFYTYGSLSITGNSYSGSTNQTDSMVGMAYSPAIDLTSFKTIKLNVASLYNSALCLFTSYGTGKWSAAKSYSIKTGQQEINIEDIEGEYYIGFGGGIQWASTNSSYITIVSLELIA